jgi:MFS family permease
MEKFKNLIKSPFVIYSGLERSIYVLFFARIVNSIGVFVYPFLTLFLTEKLEYSTGRAGLVLMLASISFIPGSIIGGKAADSFGRKKILIGAQLCSALCFMACAVIPDKQMIPILIVGAEFFLGVVHPTSMAMTVDLSKPENRRAAFSLLYLGHNLGFAVGPLLAGMLYRNHTYWLFSGDALTTILSLVLVVIFVRESKPSVQQLQESFENSGENLGGEQAEAGSVLRVLSKRPFLIVFMLLVMLMNFIYAQMSFSLPLFMNELFGAEGAVLFGTAMSFNAVIVIIFTTAIITLTRKMKPILATLLTALLYAVGFGGLYFSHIFLLIVISVFIWTVGEILGATNIDVYVSNHTPMSHRGRINSIVPVVMGIGYAVSPYVMGEFIERNSIRMVWPVCFAIGIFASAGLLMMYLKERRNG